MIRAACPRCGRLFQTPISTAGKRGVCPGCRAIVRIPAPQTAAIEPVQPPLLDSPSLAGPPGPVSSSSVISPSAVASLLDEMEREQAKASRQDRTDGETDSPRSAAKEERALARRLPKDRLTYTGERPRLLTALAIWYFFAAALRVLHLVAVFQNPAGFAVKARFQGESLSHYVYWVMVELTICLLAAIGIGWGGRWGWFAGAFCCTSMAIGLGLTALMILIFPLAARAAFGDDLSGVEMVKTAFLSAVNLGLLGYMVRADVMDYYRVRLHPVLCVVIVAAFAILGLILLAVVGLAL